MLKKITVNMAPYLRLMRLDKPIGSLLLLWPTLWALWIAAGGFPGWTIFLVFFCGVIVMRSLGCVINDIADRKVDSEVARTKHRPLAAGEMTVKQALLLFACLCLLALFLVLQLNDNTIRLSVVGLLLAVLYPFTKRFTHLAQLFLGAAYAFAIPMAFTALDTGISLIAWILFLVALVWPIAYDTIYALMDKEDDVRIGVKSTAILFGDWDRAIIFCLQLLVLSGLFVVGQLIIANLLFYICLVIAFAMVFYQSLLIKRREVSCLYRAFYNNHWLGLVIFAGIYIQYW